MMRLIPDHPDDERALGHSKGAVGDRPALRGRRCSSLRQKRDQSLGCSGFQVARRAGQPRNQRRQSPCRCIDRQRRQLGGFFPRIEVTSCQRRKDTEHHPVSFVADRGIEKGPEFRFRKSKGVFQVDHQGASRVKPVRRHRRKPRCGSPTAIVRIGNYLVDRLTTASLTRYGEAHQSTAGGHRPRSMATSLGRQCPRHRAMQIDLRQPRS